MVKLVTNIELFIKQDEMFHNDDNYTTCKKWPAVEKDRPGQDSLFKYVSRNKFVLCFYYTKAI